MNYDCGHMKYHIEPKLVWVGCSPLTPLTLTSWEGCQPPGRRGNLAGVPLRDRERGGGASTGRVGGGSAVATPPVRVRSEP